MDAFIDAGKSLKVSIMKTEILILEDDAVSSFVFFQTDRPRLTVAP
jgi:hypothetical protein